MSVNCQFYKNEAHKLARLTNTDLKGVSTIKNYKLSIIIPVLNESVSLIETVKVVLATCNKDDLAEIIIVVAQSANTDCLAAVEEVCGLDKDINFITFAQKEPGFGKAALEALKKITGNHLVGLAADGDTDPYLVHKMIEVSKKKPQAIILASRWMKGGGFEGYGVFEKFLNKIFNLMLQILFWTKMSDLTYGYRLVPMNLLHSVKIDSPGLSLGFETNLRMLRLGYEFEQIPAVWRVRKEGESSNSFFNKVGYLKYVFKIRFSKKDSNLADMK